MMQDEKERVRLRITGRVQGVGFRWFVVAEGRRLGIAGWVRNNADGSVELEAEGTPTQLASLRNRVSKGPPASRVDDIQELISSTDRLPEKFATVRV